MKNPQIVGIGVSTLDLLMRVEQFPDGEANQKALDSTLQGGGPVATALAAASEFGATTEMLDRIGSDWRGDLILEDYRSHGVGVTHLQQAPQTESALASVWVRREDGARTIAFCPGTCGELAPKDIPEGLIENAQILHLNGRHLESSLVACERARAAGTRISFDGGAGRYREEILPLVEQSEIVLVAADWARQYGGEQDLGQASEAIWKLGPEMVGITDGARGSWIWSRPGHAWFQPAFPSPDLVDTTGCGDVWHGAFLACLAQEMPLNECQRLASAAASLNTTALGGRGNLVDLETARDFADSAERH